MNGVVGFRVRRVPLNFCSVHHQVGTWAEDGTARWHCPDCVHDAITAAEYRLRIWRAVHQGGHGIRTNGRCPYCNPRADA